MVAHLAGGSGDDFIFTSGDMSLVIDAGDGNDLVQITAQQSGPATVTLGAGADILAYEPGVGWTAPVVVTDFQGGDAGDQFVDVEVGVGVVGWAGTAAKS